MRSTKPDVEKYKLMPVYFTYVKVFRSFWISTICFGKVRKDTHNMQQSNTIEFTSVSLQFQNWKRKIYLQLENAYTKTKQVLQIKTQTCFILSCVHDCIPFAGSYYRSYCRLGWAENRKFLNFNSVQVDSAVTNKNYEENATSSATAQIDDRHHGASTLS